MSATAASSGRRRERAGTRGSRELVSRAGISYSGRVGARTLRTPGCRPVEKDKRAATLRPNKGGTGNSKGISRGHGCLGGKHGVGRHSRRQEGLWRDRGYSRRRRL